MTYNILAQKYAQTGWHNYCPSKYLKWESRKSRILEEIAAYDSDIVCLQEVQSDVYEEDLRPWMAKRGYQGLYLARQYGENVQYPPEGVALFFRKKDFESLQTHSFLFSSVPTQPPVPSALGLSSLEEADDGPTAAVAAAAAAAATATANASSVPLSTLTTADWDAASLSSVSDAETGADSEAETEAEAAVAAAAAAIGAGRGAGGGGGGGGSRRSRGRASSSSAAAAAAGAAAVGDADSGPSTSGRSSASSNGNGTGGHRGGGNNEFWSVFTRRQEGAILALLRHRASGRTLATAVTHLFWNPAFPDVKAFQAAVLCREVAAFLRRHGGGGMAPEAVPVILAGDFNSLSRKRLPDTFDQRIPRGPDGLVSGVYTLLTRGSLPPDHPDHPATRRRPGETGNPDFRDVELNSSGIRLASAYYLATGRDPPLTTRTATFAGCLDYIFVTPQHFAVTNTLELPYEGDLVSYDNVRDPMAVGFPPIPNDVFPSDHLSLVATLRFQE